MASAAKNFHKLFVSNLPWTIGNTELKYYFSQFGPIAHARVIFNRETGLSKQYGFLEIIDKNTYESILNREQHKLDGKVINIKHTFE